MSSVAPSVTSSPHAAHNMKDIYLLNTATYARQEVISRFGSSSCYLPFPLHTHGVSLSHSPKYEPSPPRTTSPCIFHKIYNEIVESMIHYLHVLQELYVFVYKFQLLHYCCVISVLLHVLHLFFIFFFLFLFLIFT